MTRTISQRQSTSKGCDLDAKNDDVACEPGEVYDSNNDGEPRTGNYEKALISTLIHTLYCP